MSGENRLSPDAALSIAARALGRQLSDPVQLSGGSGWSLVLRCADQAGGTVVVKAYPPTRDGPSCFAAEAAGLSVCARTGLAPELLAADAENLTVVMSDLGSGPSMADVLLGSDPDLARRTVLEWAAKGGELAAATFGRRRDFETAKSRFLAGRPDFSDAEKLSELIMSAGEKVADLAARQLPGLEAVQVPDGVQAEVRRAAHAVAPSRHPVFSPGDMCPDNNLITGAGLRFVDFESAGIYSVFLDAAYIRMPFSTCWCVFRLPPDLAAEAESAYRKQLPRPYPELADDAIWEAGLRGAVIAWSLSSFTRLLTRGAEADEPMEPDRQSPRIRQLIRHRWQVLAEVLAASGDFPALQQLTQSLLAATERWRAEDLPLYPAFRDSIAGHTSG